MSNLVPYFFMKITLPGTPCDLYPHLSAVLSWMKHLNLTLLLQSPAFTLQGSLQSAKMHKYTAVHNMSCKDI